MQLSSQRKERDLPLWGLSVKGFGHSTSLLAAGSRDAKMARLRETPQSPASSQMAQVTTHISSSPNLHLDFFRKLLLPHGRRWHLRPVSPVRQRIPGSLTEKVGACRGCANSMLYGENSVPERVKKPAKIIQVC